jgi:hypothetical protein
MKQEITGEMRFTPIQVFTVYESNGYESKPVGHFSEQNAAEVKVGNMGGYGSLHPTQLYTTDGINVYEVKYLGRLVDIDEQERETMLKSIKSKLSPAEWEFYQKHSK